jgi:lipid-binding SYLF domain-containing protein
MTTKILALFVALSACATAPKSPSSRAELEHESLTTLSAMTARDPGLDAHLRSSAGYAVFPNIGKGGFIAGAAYGRGVLYEHGVKAGFIELNQASLGAQIGGQTFAELIVFQNPADVAKVKAGEYSISGNASAVALTAGAAAATQFQNGVAVFVMPHGGVMAEMSVSGQKLNFVPRG